MSKSAGINWLSDRLEDQKKFYKNSKKSLCQKCSNYNMDCTMAMRCCEADKSTGFSCVTSCSHLNKSLVDENLPAGQSISAMSAESRIDMMGGGFNKDPRFKKEE